MSDERPAGGTPGPVAGSRGTGTRPRLTASRIQEMKRRGDPIVVVTAYDFPTARLADQAGIEILLVGDSLGTVVLGYESTLPVTVEDILHHTRAVTRARTAALVVADMPFMSYQVSDEQAVLNAGRLVKEGGDDAVKLEGGERVVPAVRRMIEAGIPVMGHLGLTPQSVLAFGGYKVQARGEADQERLLRDARLLEQAGCFSLVLEGIPARLGAQVTREVGIPTIGIGAGASCDGQVLVSHDLLGLFLGHQPKFVRRYADLGEAMREAFAHYAADVKARRFPSDAESY